MFSTRCSEHITPLLHNLHWLRVPERIRFHLCVLTDHCLNGTAPLYMRRAYVGRLTLTARRLRQLSSSCPFADRHWANWLSPSLLHGHGTVCHRLSKLHHHFSLSNTSSRHFCSCLTDLTFATAPAACS